MVYRAYLTNRALRNSRESRDGAMCSAEVSGHGSIAGKKLATARARNNRFTARRLSRMFAKCNPFFRPRATSAQQQTLAVSLLHGLSSNADGTPSTSNATA